MSGVHERWADMDKNATNKAAKMSLVHFKMVPINE